jgi:cardiolipin synthase
MTMGWSWLPNALTVGRILLTLPLAWAIFTGRPLTALLLAAIGGASDALDGWLAKRHRWQSRLGSVLDPIADKLMMLAAVVPLGAIGALPLWLVLLILVRDLVIVAGAVAWHRLIAPLDGQPTKLSKATTLAQVLLVIAALVERIEPIHLPAPLWQGMVLGTAALTLASGLHYVITWGLRARREWRRRSAR